MSQIIDGTGIAAQLKEELKKEIAQLAANNIKPGLAVILVGNDPASHTYVKNKEKACQSLGIHSLVVRLPEATPEAEVIAKVQEFNGSPQIHAILVQLPLPAHIRSELVLSTILPHKDADGFHPINIGKLVTGEPCPLPCTPAGILHLLQTTGSPIEGKEAVVIGRSNIVGKPTAMLLLRQNATVTICHSRTRNLAQVAGRADILIAAIGKAKLIDREFVKPGAIIIDVGMNRDQQGKLCGDVDFESVREVAGWITPVPGGVGPMTIAMLMKNTVAAARYMPSENRFPK